MPTAGDDDSGVRTVHGTTTLLGGVHILRDGIALPLRSVKARAVLGSLLVQVNDEVSIASLVNSVWPHGRPASAVKNLHAYVHRLRGLLWQAGLVDRLHTTASGYRLVLRPAESDVLQVRELGERAGRAYRGGDCEQAVRLCESALALWRGPVMGDLADSAAVLAARIAGIDEVRLAVISTLVAARFALGQGAALVGMLPAIIMEQPFNERLRGYLIDALARSGRKAEALRSYQELSDLLEQELGVQPALEVRKLREAVVHDRLPTAGPDLGQPLPGVPVTPTQLPRDLPDFTGRQTDSEAIAKELTAGQQARLVVVHGPAGIGTSSTAVHVGHLIADRFPGGLLYARLCSPGLSAGGLPGSRDSRGTREVLAGFLAALGAPVNGDADALAARFRSVTAQAGPCLVVLDDAADPEQVLPLLPTGLACATLVASRRMLPTLAGARWVPLAPMDVDESIELLIRMVGRRRVLAAPQATRFVVDCCEGFPLALRAAGARLAARPSWRMADLAELLADEDRRVAELEISGIDLQAQLWTSVTEALLPIAADPLGTCRALGAVRGPVVTADYLVDALGVAEADAGAVLEVLADGSVLTPGVDGGYRIPGLFRSAAAELTAGR